MELLLALVVAVILLTVLRKVIGIVFAIFWVAVITAAVYFFLLPALL